MPCVGDWEAFVHLAYLDDSGTDKHSSIVMCGAVIIFPDLFWHIENFHCGAIQQMFESDEVEEKFQEFHASELYEGDGPFKGIEEAKRFNAIRNLLVGVQAEKVPYIYAAIDRTKLKNSPLGSANPLDVAFRICALGIEDWARSRHPHNQDGILLDHKDMCLFIFDDTEDKPLKNHLRNSYRTLRHARPFIPRLKQSHNRLWHAHDDMYFGDSRESVGIQMADLCNYFMWRHLEQKRVFGEDFFQMFRSQAIAAKPEPEWSTFGDLFVTHDSNEPKEAIELKNDQSNAKGQTT